MGQHSCERGKQKRCRAARLVSTGKSDDRRCHQRYRPIGVGNLHERGTADDRIGSAGRSARSLCDCHRHQRIGSSHAEYTIAALAAGISAASGRRVIRPQSIERDRARNARCDCCSQLRSVSSRYCPTNVCLRAISGLHQRRPDWHGAGGGR